MRKGVLVLGMALGACLFAPAAARADNEAITVPVILADYYGWAYAEAFVDKADVYGFTTAGVDALGWTLILSSGDNAGLFLVNTAGIAKTFYPVVALLGASDTGIRQRAWAALGTHAATLVTLEIFGRPALSLKTSMGPSGEGAGVEMAFKF